MYVLVRVVKAYEYRREKIPLLICVQCTVRHYVMRDGKNGSPGKVCSLCLVLYARDQGWCVVLFF